MYIFCYLLLQCAPGMCIKFLLALANQWAGLRKGRRGGVTMVMRYVVALRGEVSWA